MKVITIANQKGGVGKTTIATNFACISAYNGNKTILIDADLQESSMKFRALRPDTAPQFQAFSITTPTIHKDISGFVADYVFIDVGGRDNAVFRSSISAANVILIPLLPSQYDLWSSEETFKLIEEMRTFKHDLKVGAILNQVIAGTTISKEVQEVMDDFIKKYKLKMFDNKLYSRVAYKESVSEGLAVTEILSNPKYEKAKDEMSNLFIEVREWL
jgi:chromosome partitioning protein